MTTLALDSQTLGVVFASRPDILASITQTADSPSRVALFNEIAAFVYDKISDDAGEPAAKRRRVGDNGNNAQNGTIAVKSGAPVGRLPAASNGAADVSAEPVRLEVKEISVSVPQRKKYELCFTDEHLYARVPGTTTPAAGMAYAWRDIAHVFRLPVPEKTTAQHNYVIIPRNSCLPSSKTAPPPTDEPLVFTVPSTPPKQGTIQGPDLGQASAVSDSYVSLFDWAISARLRAVSSRTSVVASDPNVFQSASRQMIRPGEKPVHVKAFRGSKDGYLFFLPTGILWAFKKPLLFIPLDRIAAVSYTSVLQRTFNVVVEAFVVPGEGEADGGTEEIEFAMLDQVDYNAIDQSYVRRHGLQDRSLAEQRKAKLELAENARAGRKDAVQEGGAQDERVVDDEGGAAAGSGEFAGMSALQIAEIEVERQLQDAEDEEEEDFVPESDGDSDGSGSSSEEEDSDGEGEEEEEEEDEENEEGEGDEAVEGEEAEEEAEEEEEEAAQARPAAARGAAPVEEDQVMTDSIGVAPSGYYDDDEDEHLDVGA